jgi:hypothetical protein
VTTQAISTPTRADPARKPQIRALAVAFAAGVICTSLAVCVLDIVLLRRRRRRDERQSDNAAARAQNEPSVGESDPGRSPSRAEQPDATRATAPEAAAAGAEMTGDMPEPDTHHALAGARRRESGPPHS